MFKQPYTVTAGHGDNDPGATYHGLTERDLMTELRDKIAKILRERGHQVLTDGDAGINQSLFKALRLIVGSSAAIELHTNASTNRTATGVEVISLPKDKALAQALAKAIADVLGLPLRGDKGWIDQSQSHRGKLGFVSKGGLIVELFFLSNAHDTAMFQTRKDWVAKAICDVLDNY